RRLHRRDAPGRERLRHELPELLLARRIHRDDHRRGGGGGAPERGAPRGGGRLPRLHRTGGVVPAGERVGRRGRGGGGRRAVAEPLVRRIRIFVDLVRVRAVDERRGHGRGIARGSPTAKPGGAITCPNSQASMKLATTTSTSPARKRMSAYRSRTRVSCA